MKALLTTKSIPMVLVVALLAGAIGTSLLRSTFHAQAQGTVPITGFPIPTANSEPRAITNGPDGALWFTELVGNQIGRITTSGSVTEFPIPTANSGPGAITHGPDGAVWFTENTANQIGRITTSGSITEFVLPITSNSPDAITSGSDGGLWFAEAGANQIGRITTSGSVTEFPIPTANSVPLAITNGPDGALWFTEGTGNQIGRITTSGSISEFPIPTANSGPLGITSGPDGALWFTEGNGNANKIGRITTSGSITEFVLPIASSAPWGITSGPDGALWFAEVSGRIGRITTSGSISEFPIPAPGSGAFEITSGPDGNLWFTEQAANQIGQFNPSATPPPTPTSTPTPTTFVFTAPFTSSLLVPRLDPLPKNVLLATLNGFNKVIHNQQDLHTGKIGYSLFAWGGLTGDFNASIPPDKNEPTEQASLQSLMGITFTAPSTGTYHIRAVIELHGNGRASAGANAIDFVLELLPGSLAKQLLTGGRKALLRTQATATNAIVLQVQTTTTANKNQPQFASLEADSVLHSDQSATFSGTATVETTVQLNAGDVVPIQAGLQTGIVCWGNAGAVVQPLDSRLVEIDVTKQ